MRRLLLILSAAVVALVSGLSGSAVAAAHPSATGASHRYVHVCAAPPPGDASCNAIRADSVDPSGRTKPAASYPSGFVPSDLQAAYNLPSNTAGSGQTVAIIDAYDDPNAEHDVNTYRAQFGIPACTTTNGCFKKVNQQGGTKYPKANGGWAQEISLDLDMVSAICPSCHMLLVEASSSSMTNLGAAVNEAARLGATEISNSYGGSESASDITYDAAYFTHPGIPITVSSGDGGYGVEYPAASTHVTAVGGTRLTRDASSRGWTESVWSTSTTEGAGSGCSKYDAQPTWQSSIINIAESCSKRAVADVAAVADPATGVAVYDSYRYQGLSGWLVFGGTSVAAPIVALVYALAGHGTSISDASFPYDHSGSLYDVTTGATSSCGTALCTARAGWDGPTGLGTPDGTGGF